MKVRNFKTRLSCLLAIMIVFSMNTIAFASENETPSKQFGDVLYVDDGITVFYGNPHENEEAAKAVESQSARSLQHNQVWIDANTSADRTISIPASSSSPITYYTIRQETTAPLESSHVYVFRPDGSTGFVWQMNNTTHEIKDRVVGTKVLPNKAYAWTSGSLKLRWKVETGNSGARMNLWVW